MRKVVGNFLSNNLYSFFIFHRLVYDSATLFGFNKILYQKWFKIKKTNTFRNLIQLINNRNKTKFNFLIFIKTPQHFR